VFNCNDRLWPSLYFAAKQQRYSPPTQLTQKNKAGALLRLLLVQDQTKAFAYVAQAEAAGKISADPSYRNR